MFSTHQRQNAPSLARYDDVQSEKHVQKEEIVSENYDYDVTDLTISQPFLIKAHHNTAGRVLVCWRSHCKHVTAKGEYMWHLIVCKLLSEQNPFYNRFPATRFKERGVQAVFRGSRGDGRTYKR